MIHRRQFIKTASVMVAGAVTGIRGCAPSKRPNIIFILTDDQRWDALGVAGNPVIQTPNLDLLADGGSFFRNAFVSTAISMASRATIFTGLYERTHGCNFNTGDLYPEFWQSSYPVLLRQSGYHTGFIGKFGLAVSRNIRPQNQYDNGWHDIHNLPIKDFDAWYGFAGQGKYYPEGENGRHLTRIMTDQAIEFFRQSPVEKPFCLSISFKAPHAPYTPDPEFDHLYQDQEIPAPQTGTKEHFDRLPDFIKTSHAHKGINQKGYWQRRYSTPDKYQYTMKQYYRLIAGVDSALGKIRKELEIRGLAENTVIIFMGDNGEFESEHLLGGKALLREESIKVPLIVYDPRSKQKKRLNELASNVDIAPTLLEIAGISAPESMQGRNLMPLVYGNASKWRQDVFCENHFKLDEQNRNPQIYPICDALRSEKWKYIQYYDQDPVYEELFDLESDPGETQNLVYHTEYAKELQQLRNRLNIWREKLVLHPVHERD